MSQSLDIASFLGEHFRSVWALELLFVLKQQPDKSFSERDLVDVLRASDRVVRTSVEDLLAGGLILLDDDGARYAPASKELGKLVDAAELLYAQRPGAVRRLVIARTHANLSAFADSFRFRQDP